MIPQRGPGYPPYNKGPFQKSVEAKFHEIFSSFSNSGNRVNLKDYYIGTEKTVYLYKAKNQLPSGEINRDLKPADYRYDYGIVAQGSSALPPVFIIQTPSGAAPYGGYNIQTSIKDGGSKTKTLAWNSNSDVLHDRFESSISEIIKQANETGYLVDVFVASNFKSDEIVNGELNGNKNSTHTVEELLNRREEVIRNKLIQGGLDES